MNKFIYILAILFFFQCKPENNIDNVPSNFIEKEQFIQLVYEVNVLEGNFNNFNLNKDLMKDSSMRLYKGIFEKYKIDYEDFKENQEYYILTDQYKEVSEKALELVIAEAEKYKDVKPVVIMSYLQFTQLFETDEQLIYMQEDTNSTFDERLDSMLNYYKKNPKNLKDYSLDSLSFEVNIAKLRRGRDIFRKKTIFEKSVFKANE